MEDEVCTTPVATIGIKDVFRATSTGPLSCITAAVACSPASSSVVIFPAPTDAC